MFEPEEKPDEQCKVIKSEMLPEEVRELYEQVVSIKGI